jgi:CBS domain-containing protein
MPVGTHCQRNVWTIGPDATVRETARMMASENVGCLIVVEERKPVGIVTDRDVALEVLIRHLDADATRVREVMRSPAITIDEAAPLSAAVDVMRVEGVRRLPVVDGSGTLVGVITVDDLALLLAGELKQITGPIAAQHVATPPNPVHESIETAEWWR